MAARVLVVDDSMSVRKAIEKMLGDKLDIVTVDSPQAARKSIIEKRPVLIISDVIMPAEDGFMFSRSLKKHPKTKAIPILLMSGVVDSDSQQQARAAGAIGLLKKPFTKEELTNIVGRIFAQLKQRQQRLKAEKQKRLEQERLAAQKKKQVQAAQQIKRAADDKQHTPSSASTVNKALFELSPQQRQHIQKHVHHITTRANALNGWLFSAGVAQCQIGNTHVDPQELALFLYLMREAGVKVGQDLKLDTLETTMFEYKAHTLLISTVLEQAGETMTIVLLLDANGALSMARYLLRKTIPEIRQLILPQKS